MCMSLCVCVCVCVCVRERESERKRGRWGRVGAAVSRLSGLWVCSLALAERC